MHVVIIGNGIAGINVASAIRAAQAEVSDLSVSIDVYTADWYPFYSRVRLPEILSGLSSSNSLTFYQKDWYEKKNIDVHTGRSVVKICRDEKRVELLDGTFVSYDYLVLALGSSSNKLSVPGAGLPDVYTLRSMDDACAIRSWAQAHPDSASVVGGGLLGLETAIALKSGGSRSVHVFEIADRLLPKQLDDIGANLLKQRFLDLGIDIVCGSEVKEFGNGSVTLKDGRFFKSSTSVLSMGVQPNIGLAKGCGLSVNKGIIVDERLRTVDPSIFAVGDCAEFSGVVWGIIPAALEQASVAAKSILAAGGFLAEENAPLYAQTIPKTALKVGSLELMSLGKAVLSQEELSQSIYELRFRVWDDGSRYERYVLTPGTMEKKILAGAIMYGSKANHNRVQGLMGKEVTLTEIDGLLAN